MLKKIMYSILGLLVVVFIYNTYIKEEEIVRVDVNQDMRLIEVTYRKNQYRVEADEQNEIEAEQKIYFDIARAYFEKTFMRGKQGIFDRVSSNLSLIGDVYGINEENGWKIEGHELVYLQQREIFYSRTGMKAFNKDMGLTIESDYFESDADINNLKLEKNVHAYTESHSLKSDRAYYSNMTSILNLEGNVRVVIKHEDEQGNPLPDIEGDFLNANYNTSTGILVSRGSFEVRYDGYTMTGQRFRYNENTRVLLVEGDVVVTKDTNKLYMDKATLSQDENRIVLEGSVRGLVQEGELEARLANIDTETEDIELIGDVVFRHGGNKLEADRAEYIKEDSLLKAFGEAKEIVYTGDNLIGRFYYGEYKLLDETINIPGVFIFDRDENELKTIVEGEELYFDTVSQRGSAVNPIVYNGDDWLRGDRGIFDFTKNYHILEGLVLGLYGDYNLETIDAEYDEGNGKIYLNNPYILVSRVNSDKLESTSAILDVANSYYYLNGKVFGTYGDYYFESSDVELDELNEIIYLNNDYLLKSTIANESVYGQQARLDRKNTLITSDKRSHINNDDFYGYGDKLYYNYLEGFGSLEANVYINSKKDEVIGRSDRAEFRLEDHYNFYGNVVVEQGEYTGETEEARYSIIENLIELPIENRLYSSLRDLEMHTQSGVYYLEDSRFIGQGYEGRSTFTKGRSDHIEFYLQEEKIYMQGAVKVEDLDLEMILESDRLEYYRATDYAVSPSDLRITRNNIFLDAEQGEVNLRLKTMFLRNPILTTNIGDKVSGDNLFGNYHKNEFNFDGNIEGAVYTMNEAQLQGLEEVDYNWPLKFNGRLAKLYFIEDSEDNFVVTRTEIRDESRFIYKDMELEGDFLEAQGSSQKLFARGNSVINLQGENRISAESIVLNMFTEEADMTGNVRITGISQEAGGINTRADMARLSNRTSEVKLEGNIESYRGETKFMADSGTFDLQRGTLSGRGNIYLTMDFETFEEAQARSRREEAERQKIEDAKREVDLPNEIPWGVDHIGLLAQHDNVRITWQSSHRDYIDLDGSVYHPEYKEEDVIVRLTATYISGEMSQRQDYYLRVHKEDKKSYLKRLVNNVKFNYNSEEHLISIDLDEAYRYKILDESNIIDQDGKFLVDIDEIDGKTFGVLYYLEDIHLESLYKIYIAEDGQVEIKVEGEVEKE